MGAEHVPGAGGEPVIDATLAARLLRPLVRPGVSDPAHGPSLAARLQRMTAPSLADDVARRYGSATLGGDRPPVVYAAPPAPPGLPADSSASSVPHPAPGEPTRPVVRASERATGPVFPPVRPLGAGPAVQRLADPAPPAAALPVVVSRRPAPEPPGG
ncbi:MAG TPA: hypothetical protein VHG28_00835, partial [Longimicrobiaceae bacterium]|nr:hypothetical protein [Longimicrobiaceae bacterium]